jgi:hypothetical protein
MRVVGLWLLAVALSWVMGCSNQVRSTDGNTSWLRECSADTDCNGGQCRCGVCTDTCEESSTCPNSGSRCVRAGSSAFTAACGASSTLAGVCLPECPAGGCGAGRVCHGGACVPVMSPGASSTRPPAQPDASMPRILRDSGAPPDSGTPAEPRHADGSVAPPPPKHADGSVAPPPPMAPDATVLPASCSNLTGNATGPTISFRNDLLPMFGLSCTVSDCHRPSDQKAGLNLGYECAYDPNAKWKCTFPVTANPDPSQPQPDDEQTVADIYASLMAPALTVTSPVVQRVLPGYPTKSFLVLSLANQQNNQGFQCINQDPSHESNPPPCGVAMPQNQALYCEGLLLPKFQAIVDWIAQGAPNN